MSQFEFQAMPPEVFKDNVGIMKNYPYVITKDHVIEGRAV